MKVNSEGLMTIYINICTFQNILLCGIYWSLHGCGPAFISITFLHAVVLWLTQPDDILLDMVLGMVAKRNTVDLPFSKPENSFF